VFGDQCLASLFGYAATAAESISLEGPCGQLLERGLGDRFPAGNWPPATVEWEVGEGMNGRYSTN
jgi:hypothetical protein